MRAALSVFVGLFVGSATNAQTVLLAEKSSESECLRYAIETSLNGTLQVTRDGKPVQVKVTARNEHAFVERVLAVEKSFPRKTIRSYAKATSKALIDGEKTDRELSPVHKLIVAQRPGDSLFCYSPAGPLTRAELEVVSQHFETLQITGILPGRDVRIGDSWKLDPGIAQSLCLFDGLISHDLMVKLKESDGKSALLTIEGSAKGIEIGALATLTISATVRFDLTKKRIVAVEWKQKDVRDQGPASPAAEVETTTKLTRELLDRQPDELTDAALSKFPTTNEPSTTLQSLLHRDARGRYEFLHSREWHMVGQTDFHLVMRLLDRGDFLAQATITNWTSAGAGKHMSAEEFEKLVAGGRGWRMEGVFDRSEIPTDADRWIYRIAARGELDGIKVVQHFYVVANAAGDQMIVTITMKPNASNRIGTRDVALVNAIDVGKR